MADILTIGSSGLSAYRRSLEVTGNNIVNANTEGYARRDVQLQGAGEAATTPTSLLSGSGSGVAVDLVRRATDVFVQSEKRLTQSASSAASALSDRLDRLEKAMFSGDGDLGQLSQTFFSRLQDFATTPSAIAVRTTVIQAANDLSDGFNVQANRLLQESNAIVSDAQSQFDNLNTLAQQLADLNKQIESLGSDKGKANDLLDQRDKLVDGIVKIAGVTVETRQSGAVNLYMGDSTSGPQLVGPNGAKALAASRVNGHLQVSLDPYGANIPISQIRGGAVGGIQSFDDQITSMANQLDRLAVGFAKRVNDQHAKGIDLEGQKGLQVFSTDTFTITAGKTNKGSSAATLDMGQVGAVEPGDYRATFNQNDGKWTIVNLTSGQKQSGTDKVTIDGMTVQFAGRPANGDTYTFSPLTNAASAMRVMLDDPKQLAASLPQLAEAVAGNTSTATIDLTDSAATVGAPALPSLSAIFNRSLAAADAVGFKQDAIVSSIPSGSGPVTLYSYGDLSSASFKVDGAAGATSLATDSSIIQSLGAGTLSLIANGISFSGINSISLFPSGVPSDLASSSNPAQTLADEINRAFGETALSTSTPPGATTLADAFYASVNNGYVTINALGENEISSAAFTATATGTSAFASTTKRATAADIALVTRDGAQIAGQTAVANTFLRNDAGKPTNGFLPDAMTPSVPIGDDNGSDKTLTYNYRTLMITDERGPVSKIDTTSQTGARTSVISFDVTPEADSPWISGSAPASTNPGAVYSLSVDGVSKPIRLAGSAIAGKSSADIASLMADKLNALGPQRLLVGGSIDFSDADHESLAKASFIVSLGGEDATVTFTRNVDADGNYLPSGTFSVSGNTGLTASMVPVDSTDPTGLQNIILTLPKTLATSVPSLSMSGDQASALGFSAGQIQERIIASATNSTDLATARTSLANFSIASGAVSVTSDGRVMISKTLGGTLSRLTMTGLASTTTALKSQMTSIGFVGSDLTVRRDGANLSLTSSVVPVANEELNTLADTSQTVSRIGHKVRITSTVEGAPIPEDILIAVQGNDTTGVRKMAANFEPDTVRQNPTMPDIEVEVTDSNEISIYAIKLDSLGQPVLDSSGAPQRGDLLAKRTYQPGVPVTYLDSSFVIDGNAANGDRFRITTDPTRTGDNRNALAMIDIGATDLLNKGSGAFRDIYAAAVSKIGSSAQAAKTAASSAKTVADNVAAAYDSATGVNLDTEAAELIKLQQAYSACAQIVTTAREMFDMILRAF